MSSIAEPLEPLQWRYDSQGKVLRAVALMAVLLHALLLLIPAKKPAPVPIQRSVAVDVRFKSSARDEALPTPPVEPVPVPQPVPQTVPMPESLPESLPSAPSLVAEPVLKTRPEVTTALLLEQARALEWKAPDQPARTPGLAYIPDLPPNLARPVLPMTPNRFDSYVLRGEQEILDQWMEPGGTINAVVKLPNGDILCGRLSPWSMMDPLVEPVAMYRPCGGGGKRAARASPFSSRN
jgi:hypothetical protein